MKKHLDVLVSCSKIEEAINDDGEGEGPRLGLCQFPFRSSLHSPILFYCITVCPDTPMTVYQMDGHGQLKFHVD